MAPFQQYKQIAQSQVIISYSLVANSPLTNITYFLNYFQIAQFFLYYFVKQSIVNSYSQSRWHRVTVYLMKSKNNTGKAVCLFQEFFIWNHIIIHSFQNIFHLYNQSPMQVGIATKSLDICFYNSLDAVKSSYVRQASLHLLQFLAMVIMIPIDILVLQHSNEQVLSFFITASCITFMNLVAKVGHLSCTLRDQNNVMSIAEQLGHTIMEQPNSQRLGQLSNQQTGILVSPKIYNIQTNTNIEQVNQQIKNSLEPVISNVIKTLALSRDPINRCTISLGSGISFALFIYGIVILCTVPQMKTGEIVVMSLFLISEFLVQIQVFLCLIFIALIPLLCIIICFYACFCKQGAKQAKLPEAVSATVDIIQKSDGSPCSICFQNIMLDEQVIVLPCSDKHVFHDKCIAGWTALKATCPICRHDLSQ